LKASLHTINVNDFELLFKNHYTELCVFANKYLEDLDASEEIVQDLFVKFWEEREKKEITVSVRAYLFTAVKNACLNQLKHHKIKTRYKELKQREMLHSENSTTSEAETNELNEKIKIAIDALPEGRKKVFLLSRNEGLKYTEIATKLNISVKTVENQMSEALRFLRKELKEYLVFILAFIKIFNELN